MEMQPEHGGPRADAPATPAVGIWLALGLVALLIAIPSIYFAVAGAGGVGAMFVLTGALAVALIVVLVWLLAYIGRMSPSARN